MEEKPGEGFTNMKGNKTKLFPSSEGIPLMKMKIFLSKTIPLEKFLKVQANNSKSKLLLGVWPEVLRKKRYRIPFTLLIQKSQLEIKKSEFLCFKDQMFNNKLRE